MKVGNVIKQSGMVLAIAIAAVSCKKEADTTPAVTTNTTTTVLATSEFDYGFNNGQVVPTAAYNGKHNDNLSAKMKLEKLSTGKTKITVTLANTVQGATYNMHAHDAADASTTPNKTPYNETPNGVVFAQSVSGNGASVSVSQESTMAYDDIINTYSGFFVLHDPLQAISTTNIASYLVVGSFARAQTNTLASKEYNYAFNTGQVAPSFAYSGAHANTLAAVLKVQELGDGKARVSITLKNTLASKVYSIHAHDAADANTTPNGTPYNETPNSGVLATSVQGNGGTATSSQFSTVTYAAINSTYSGFLVVHDPLQTISTTNPTTYVILGLFAK